MPDPTTPATTQPATGSVGGPCRCCRQPVCGCPDPTHHTCRGIASFPPALAQPLAPTSSLLCPLCRGPVREGPPHGWQAAWGPLPSYAHADGSPLCPRPTGYRPADPILAPASRDSSGTDAPPWPGHPAAAVAALAAATRRLTTTLHPPTTATAADARAAVRALAHALAAVADCCAHLEPTVTAAHAGAGRRLVQATGAAEHLAIRLIDTFTHLERY